MPIFLTGLALLVVFLVVILTSQTKQTELPELKSLDEADLIAAHTYILGFSEAPLSIVTFSNFKNLDEVAYLDVIYNLHKENPRYLSAALRPLPKTEEGKLVSKGAQIAGDQGKYWEFATIALENSSEKADEKFLTNWAKTLGLDTGKFQKDLKEKGYEQIIEADINDADKLGINTTPTFFLNAQRLSVKNAQDLKEQLESEIARIKKEKGLEVNEEGEIIEEPEVKELTPMQKKRVETLMEVKYTAEGWDPKEAQPFKGQPVRWENTTNETIYLQPLDRNYEGLKNLVEIKPGEYFEYKFPSGGIFRYQEMATLNWGIIIIDW